MLRKMRFSYYVLLNHPLAIQEQPTLQLNSNTFEVTAMHTKEEEYDVQLTQILYPAAVSATNLTTFVSIPLQSLS